MPTMDPQIAALLHRFGLDGPAPAPAPTIDQIRAANHALSVAVAPSPPLAVATVTDTTVAGIPVRTYGPVIGGGVPTIVFFHGGGFVVGDLDTHDHVCRRLCRELGAVVVSVSYRLAPEFRYPAAHEDCLTVTRYVSDHPAEFGGGPLAVAEDSAGGNLAASVAQVFRDENRCLAAQLLAYPATDLSGKGDYPSLTENATGFLLTTAEVHRNIALYLDDSTQADDGPLRPRCCLPTWPVWPRPSWGVGNAIRYATKDSPTPTPWPPPRSPYANTPTPDSSTDSSTSTPNPAPPTPPRPKCTANSANSSGPEHL